MMAVGHYHMMVKLMTNPIEMMVDSLTMIVYEVWNVNIDISFKFVHFVQITYPYTMDSVVNENKCCSTDPAVERVAHVMKRVAFDVVLLYGVE